MSVIYGYIYKITNLVNNKIYIGQTTVGFDQRYKGTIRNTHNGHLKRAIEKYGEENFLVEKEFAIAHSQQELDELEAYYIDKFNSCNSSCGYNKTTGGEHYTPTQEVKEKISRANKGRIHSEETRVKWSEQRRGEGNGMYGKHHKEETLVKIREARAKQVNPMLGRTQSEETRAKIAQKRSKKVRCNTGEEFNSALEASKWCNLKCQTTICKSCNDENGGKSAGRHPITGEKLYWKYIN